MSRHIHPTYKTTNWPAYNEALKRRGSLTIWFDPEMIWDARPSGKRGRQQSYSDTAIQTCLTMKVLFGMALRQTTGFVESLLHLIGLNWVVPDFSTLSRRQKTLAVNIPYRGSKGPLHLLIDSTGIKVEGEGALSAACLACACRVISGTHASIPLTHASMCCRAAGGPKRRLWRKIHLGIDEETLEVRAVEITGSHIGDAPVLPNLLNQIPADETIGSVTAPSRDIASRCPAGQWTVPMILENATTLSLAAGRMPSSHPAKTHSRGRPSLRVLWPETRPCELRNTSVARSGETGADTTAEAASRPTLSGSCFA
jgi:hypothetical protein